MCSETLGYISDNLVTSQMLFCDSRMILKKIREKIFGLENEFFRILGMPNFEAFSVNVHKNWRTWLQTALKNFLEIWCTCSKYWKCLSRSGLSNEPTLVTIRRVETKWCKKNKKRRPDAPFEFHFSILKMDPSAWKFHSSFWTFSIFSTF